MVEPHLADPKAHYGSPRAATGAFMLQRITAILNVAFVMFVVFIATRAASTPEAAITLISTPWIGIPFALLIAGVCLHMRIGMHEIIQDYVHGARANRMANLANDTFAVTIALVAGLSILKLVFFP